MPMHCYQFVAKEAHNKVLTLCELGSMELMSVEVLVLSPLGFGAAVNFGRVILSPFLRSEQSLVRMWSRELSL
jgi:hypothetical protein